MRLLKPVLLLLAGAVVLPGQPQMGQASLSGAPKVELKGTIERVQSAPGQGMPFLELKTGKAVQRVMLGSMRYMMEQNFNPKAGNVAIVQGFVSNDLVFARSVSIPAEKVTIQFRDENGVPLWRMGRYGWKKQ